MGVLVAFFQYGLRFFRPIQDMSEKYNILQGAMAASERIFKLLDTKPAIVAPFGDHAFPDGPLDVEFDHVWFAYSGEDWVLKDVSFQSGRRRNSGYRRAHRRRQDDHHQSFAAFLRCSARG